MWGRLRRGLRGCPHSGLFALRRGGCLHAALVFPCIVIGPVRVSFGCLPMALAFPCILIGLLASPLCGAAPTFFAAAKKAGCNRQPVVSHLGHPAETAQDEMCPRATYLRDKALIRSSVALRAPPSGITILRYALTVFLMFRYPNIHHLPHARIHTHRSRANPSAAHAARWRDE